MRSRCKSAGSEHATSFCTPQAAPATTPARTDSAPSDTRASSAKTALRRPTVRARNLNSRGATTAADEFTKPYEVLELVTACAHVRFGERARRQRRCVRRRSRILRTPSRRDCLRPELRRATNSDRLRLQLKAVRRLPEHVECAFAAEVKR